MKNQAKIYLHEDKNMSRVNIPHFVEQWNRMNKNKKQYEVIHITTINDIQKESTIMINRHLTENLLNSLDKYLDEHPSSSICIFLSPKEIPLVTAINKLTNKHEQANIGTILKPTQFSKVKSFIDSATVKQGSLELEENWEEFNFGEFL